MQSTSISTLGALLAMTLAADVRGQAHDGGRTLGCLAPGVTLCAHGDGIWIHGPRREDRLGLRAVRLGREVDAAGSAAGEVFSAAAWTGIGDGESRSLVAARGSRTNPVEEWLQGFAGGVFAHGLVVPSVPAGSGDLVLEFACERQGYGTIDVAADAVTFVAAHGVVTYSGLAVHDASGERLAARFVPLADGFAVHVALPHEPALPLTIDPLFAYQEAEILAADAEAGDDFGRAIDIDGDTLVVGAPDRDEACTSDPDCDSGAVYVFVRSGSTWSQEAKIFDATLGAAGDQFGVSVALDGDTLAIGATGVDGSATNSGAFYVYFRTGTTWAVQANRLVPGVANADDQVGGAIDVDGDVLVVGGRNQEALGAFAGAAWIYERSGAVWSESQFITGSDTTLFDRFGSSVAVAGSWIAVGAPDSDDPMNGAGKAYVFEPSGGSWVEVADLSASDASGSDAFGTSLALDGDRLVVGARFGDRGGPTPGAAYVFLRSTGVWAEEDKLLAADLMSDDRFGTDVDIEGDRIVVGAPYDGHSGSRAGSAYVFERSGSVWTQEAKIVAISPAVLDEYGTAVALSADTVAAGAWLRDGGTISDRGSAHVHRLKVPTQVSFCYGDGGDQMGCTDCPCGNNVDVGMFTGCENSALRGAFLGGFGTPSISADTLRFEMSGGNTSTFGVLVAGNAQLPQMGACPPGSGIAQPTQLDGLRCVGQGIQRLTARMTNANGDIGITTAGWGPPNGPPGGISGFGGFMAGDTRYFAVFYREFATMVCGTGQNTSNGVTVTFVP